MAVGAAARACDGEALIHKQFNSSFEQTALEDELAKLGTTHIALAGAATNWCIRATAYGALDRGYDLTLVKDAHTTDTMDLGTGKKIEASTVVDDLNIAMTWLRYPGRRTAPPRPRTWISQAGRRLAVALSNPNTVRRIHAPFHFNARHRNLRRFSRRASCCLRSPRTSSPTRTRRRPR
jgi:hypothetical protein